MRTEHDKRAGQWETAILRELRPDLVDLTRTPAERGAPTTSIIDPECGIVVAEDPRCDDLVATVPI